MDFNEWNKAIIKEFRENGGRWVASLRVPRSPRRASARPGDRKSLARDELAIERREETLRLRVAPAIAATIHAAQWPALGVYLLRRTADGGINLTKRAISLAGRGPDERTHFLLSAAHDLYSLVLSLISHTSCPRIPRVNYPAASLPSSQ